AVLLEVDQRLAQLEGTPTVHRDAVGLLIDHVKKLAGHSIRGEKPKKPIAQALLGAAYTGGWKKR
ncbi:unnamed protein product, partial [marine sediment metagenome]